MKINVFWAALIASISFAGGSAIPTWQFISSQLKGRIGQDSDEVIVINGRLKPYPSFGVAEENPELVSLIVTVRNLSANTVYVTSGEFELSSVNRDRIYKEGGTESENYIKESPSDSNPIELKAGETKEIGFNSGILLKGISPFFEQRKIKNATCYSFRENENKYVLAQSAYIDELNSEMAMRYGERAEIKIYLYEKNKLLLKKHSFFLADGGSMFSNSGKLQHDFFIGGVMNQMGNACL